jgi:predicted DNA-binding protein with PD1-like motif
MQYTEAKLGRIFYLRIDHGEDLVSSLQQFVTEKNISAGFIHLIGALREGSIVTGPKEPVLPPDPIYLYYDNCWEIIGFATITSGKEQPYIHIHASLGQERRALTGCLREKATAYIVVEAVIIEMTGADIFRRKDTRTGLELPESRRYSQV